MIKANCTKSFWPNQNNESDTVLLKTPQTQIQPFSVYHIDQPHAIRKRHGHLGASPKCRGSVHDSMDLLRKVLQPAINKDISDLFEKYTIVLSKAAKNGIENAKKDSSINVDANMTAENLVLKVCRDMLENSKLLFKNKAEVNGNSKNFTVSSLPARLNLTKRAPSPDIPFKRNKDAHKNLPRSFTPPPRKRHKVTGPRRYGSPHRSNKEPIKREGPTWDPNHLNTSTQFVMGTKANKALGLGATRGRIYMKHPELFKYTGDPEDKKWMVKNNCMAATGGKNTFILIAEDVENLLKTEYKDSPGILYEELELFRLPEFILQKMRLSMEKEKKVALKLQLPKTRNIPSPLSEKSSPASKSFHENIGLDKSGSNNKRRSAAKAAEFAITASQQQTSDEDDLNKITGTMPNDVVKNLVENYSNRTSSESELCNHSDLL